MKYLNLLFVFLFNFHLIAQQDNSDLFEVNDFTYLRDTIYTLHPYFIEVNLTSQKGYLYSRTEPVVEFGISSGTKRLKDGVDTKEGLYVIQSMMPKWHSRQFDSTLMLNWMGFNYGIGFHALAGKNYYKYLGKKKSSHGCIRVSRETAADMYGKINLGTPVLVHNENNAVWVSFIDSTANYQSYTSDRVIDILKNRYQSFYTGRYFLEPREPLVIDFKNVNHPGLPIGERKLIPKRQAVKPMHIYISRCTPSPRGFMIIQRKMQRNFDLIGFIE